MPVERRVSVLKTRPLKNPFVVCGKIKNSKGGRQEDNDNEEEYKAAEAAFESHNARKSKNSEFSFG